MPAQRVQRIAVMLRLARVAADIGVVDRAVGRAVLADAGHRALVLGQQVSAGVAAGSALDRVDGSVMPELPAVTVQQRQVAGGVALQISAVDVADYDFLLVQLFQRLAGMVDGGCPGRGRGGV